eukprot:6102409-Lingulodinium_polyedra.AAC.1
MSSRHARHVSSSSLELRMLLQEPTLAITVQSPRLSTPWVKPYLPQRDIEAVNTNVRYGMRYQWQRCSVARTINANQTV